VKLDSFLLRNTSWYGMVRTRSSRRGQDGITRVSRTRQPMRGQREREREREETEKEEEPPGDEDGDKGGEKESEKDLDAKEGWINADARTRTKVEADRQC